MVKSNGFARKIVFLFLFASISVITTSSQDFKNSYWMDSKDDIKKQEDPNFSIIQKISFNGKDIPLPFVINGGNLSVGVSREMLNGQNIGISYGFFNEKLSCGILDFAFTAEAKDELIENLTAFFGEKTLFKNIDPLPQTDWAQLLIDNFQVLILEDVYVYFCVSNGKSMLEEIINNPSSTNPGIELYFFNSLRSKVCVLSNYIPGHIIVIFNENISHLSGIYSTLDESEGDQIFIIDNTLYHCITNSARTDFDQYPYYVNKFKLNDLKVYQYKNKDNPGIFLNVDGFTGPYVLRSNSKPKAQEIISEINSANDRVDKYKENRQIIK